MLKITDSTQVYIGATVVDFAKRQAEVVIGDRLDIINYRFDTLAGGEQFLEVTLARCDAATGNHYPPYTQYILRGDELAKLFTPGPSDGGRKYGDFRRADLYRALLDHKPSNGNRPLSDFTELEDGN